MLFSKLKKRFFENVNMLRISYFPVKFILFKYLRGKNIISKQILFDFTYRNVVSIPGIVNL